MLFWELVDRLAGIRERHGDEAARMELALQVAMAQQKGLANAEAVKPSNKVVRNME